MSIIHHPISKSISNPVSKLTLAVIATLSSSAALSAGLDRSGQDVTAFFQDGTYAEAVYTYIDADVSGVDKDNNKVDDIAEAYDFARFGVKADAGDRVSVGVLYDEPWGAAVKYTGDNGFVASGDVASNIKAVTGMDAATALGADAQLQAALPQLKNASSALQQAISNTTDPATLAALKAQKQDVDTKIGQAKKLELGIATAKVAAASAGEGTNVEIRSNSLTGLVGVKLGDKKNVQVYGGPVLQRLTGDLHLRGTNYSGATGYDAYMSPTLDVGYAVGAAYSKPEIGLRAALTYRSEIEHTTNFTETIPLAGAVSSVGKDIKRLTKDKDAGHITLKTPESVNLDFQTGINPTTLATASVRYVPWSDFEIRPVEYNALTKISGSDLPIASYSDDQWKVELGLAKRINPKLAVSGNVGWDSGAGNPVTSLGPIEGYTSAGVGAKYNMTDQLAVSVGGKYLWFGDAKANTPNGNIVGNFEDNEGFIAGVKLSYQDK